MADIGGGDARSVVVRRLERKQGQHVIDRARDRGNAAAAPGPDRGTDVVHYRNSGALQACFQAQVEVRRIHAYEQLRPRLEQRLPQPAPHPQQTRIMPQHLGVAAHRQALHRKQGGEPLGLHLGPADADKAGVRQVRAQSRDQVRAQQVAGCLPGDHADSERPLIHVSARFRGLRLAENRRAG